MEYLNADLVQEVHGVQGVQKVLFNGFKRRFFGFKGLEAQSHEELVVWQLSYQLKLGVYELIKASPIRTDRNLHDQLRNAARAAPRLIAEGFGRYLPGEFARYLRTANGELKETFDALRDAVDCGYVKQGQIVPLQRLSKRASKAASRLIEYLRSAALPNEPTARRSRRGNEPPEPP
jgi:four helix bundle protein